MLELSNLRSENKNSNLKNNSTFDVNVKENTSACF